MKADYAQQTISLEQAIQVLWKLGKERNASPSEFKIIEAYLRSLPQETTGRIRLDQLVGLSNNFQKAIQEGDAAFLGQKRGFKTKHIVDVIEFAESKQYLNIGEALYASEREDLWKIWHVKPTPLEVVLTGAQGCLAGDTDVLVMTSPGRHSGRPYTIRDAFLKFNRIRDGKRHAFKLWDRSQPIRSACAEGNTIRYREMMAVYDSGRQPVYEVKTDSGRTVVGTEIHPFKVPDGTEKADAGGFIKLMDLRPGDKVLCQDKERTAAPRMGRNNKGRKAARNVDFHPYAWKVNTNGYEYKVIHHARLVVEAHINNLPVDEFIWTVQHDERGAKQLRFLDPTWQVHHKDRNPGNDSLSNLQVLKKGDHERLHRFNGEKSIFLETIKPETIVSIKSRGEQQTFDIAMEAPHNYLANGFVVHNTFKSTTAAISTEYSLYLLSCMHSPQAELRMIPIDEIFLIIQSFKLETAEDAIYSRILRAVDASPYFQKHFPRNKKLSSELQFPNHVVLKPITGTINAVQSKNVVGGAITEINEMRIHKVSVALAHTDKQILDVGQEVFHNFRNRVMGRYKKLIQEGDFVGRIIIDSARRYLGDFTDRKTDEAKTDPLILVIERSLWSAKPFDYEGEERFYVELATEYRPARILARIEDAEQWSDEFAADPDKLLEDDWLKDNLNAIRVPESHRKDLEKDLENGLRDLAGVPATATGRFLPYPKEITAAQDRFDERTGGASLFRVQEVVLRKDMPWHEIINYDYVQQLLLEGEFRWAVHLDASLGVHDAAGIAFTRVVDTTVVEKGYFYDPSTGQLRSIQNIEMPVLCCDGVLRLLAAPGDHLDLQMVEDLVIEVKQHINIMWATADWMQSERTIQEWRSHGIVSGSQSVDRTPGAYFTLSHAIRDGRILFPRHTMLDAELRKLKRITKGGAIKIEHPNNFSKDCADALAGSCATCQRFFGKLQIVQKAIEAGEEPLIAGTRPVSGEDIRAAANPGSRAIEAVSNGKTVTCTRQEFPMVKVALQEFAAKCIDNGDAVRAQIALEELRRLSEKMTRDEDPYGPNSIFTNPNAPHGNGRLPGGGRGFGRF